MKTKYFQMFFHGILLLRRFFIVLWCFIMSKKSIMFSSINIDYGDVFLAFTMALSCTISSNEFKWFWFKRFCGQFGSVQVSRFLNGSVRTLSSRTELLWLLITYTCQHVARQYIVNHIYIHVARQYIIHEWSYMMSLAFHPT